MAAVTTTALVELAAELAGWSAVPVDCVVEEPGTRLSSLLAVAEAGPAEVFLARQLGYHAVISATSPLRVAACDAIVERERATLAALGIAIEPEDAVLRDRLLALRLVALGEMSARASAVAHLVEQPLVSIGPAVAALAQHALQARVDAVLAERNDAPVAAMIEAFQSLPAFAATPPVVALGQLDALSGDRVVVLGDLPAPGVGPMLSLALRAGVTTLCVPTLPEAVVAELRRAGMPGNVLVLGRAPVLRVGLAPYLARLRAQGIEVRSLLGEDAEAEAHRN